MSDVTLSPAEARDLQRIAGMMIPSNAEYAVPAADDATIFADILRSLGRDAGVVRNALAELMALGGGPFAELDAAQAGTVAEAFLTSGTTAVEVLGRCILQCYYRDDRVLRSLGVEPRPPFPKGYVVEQGDWSLLDAVRGRPKMWRDDKTGAI